HSVWVRLTKTGERTMLQSTEWRTFARRGSGRGTLAATALALTAMVFAPMLGRAETARLVPAPAAEAQATAATSETAVLAGGCFWGVQGVFQHVDGVTNAVSGYAGGTADTANYPAVSSHSTGHAESVQ